MAGSPQADWPRAGRLLLLAGAAVMVALATAAAFSIRPVPFSDWAYYWAAAEGSFPYERGGVMVFVLRALQALRLEPHATALLMNLAAAFGLLATAWRADGRRPGVATLPVLAYLIAITPYFGVVQFDMAATALLGSGLCLLAARNNGPGHHRTAIAGMLLIACAVSSRPQFFLVLPPFAALLLAASALGGGWRSLPRSRGVGTALALVAAALLGFATDSALRSASGRAEAVRTNSGVTLYAGLLSSTTSAGCGHWSERATREARADAALPVLEAVSGRLREHPSGHWLAVVQCKVPAILLPGPYALYWAWTSSNAAARMDGADAGIRRLYRAERLVHTALLLVIYGVVGRIVLRRARRREWAAALLPLAWLASYWAVHAIFEIQPRYFISLFLLSPFMATEWTARLVAGQSSPEPGVPATVTGPSASSG